MAPTKPIEFDPRKERRLGEVGRQIIAARLLESGLDAESVASLLVLAQLPGRVPHPRDLEDWLPEDEHLQEVDNR